MRECLITAPGSMSDETYELLCKKARYRFGDDISFRRITDDGILGGFILNIGGVCYDVSMLSQLNELADFIKEE